MAKNGHFPQKAPKVGVPGGGFTSTPRAGAPRFPGAGKKGDFTPPGRGGSFWPPGGLGTPGTPGDPRRKPRGPGARGWCKTPLAGGAGRPGQPPPGPGDPFGAPLAPGAGDPRSSRPRSRDLVSRPWPARGLPDPLPGLPGAPRPSREGGFTSTPRGGAPRFPGAGIPTPRCVEALQAAPGLEGAKYGRVKMTRRFYDRFCSP